MQYKNPVGWKKAWIFLHQCGISVNNGNDQLKATAFNFPLEIYFFRNSDIPQYLEDGVVNLGIVGENLLYELVNSLEVRKRLIFSKCRVPIAVPRDTEVKDISFFEEKKLPLLTQTQHRSTSHKEGLK